jgi:hypothetical protein
MSVKYFSRERNSVVTLESSIDLRLRSLAPRIHALGVGPLFHLLRDLAAGADLLPTAERYACLDCVAAFIEANHGDRLPAPLMVIEGGSS